LQGFSIETGGLPIIQKRSVVFPEELNGGAIPPQHIQHNAKTILRPSDGCDTRKKSVANLFSTKLSTNKKIFEE
jgi:hypothetical protein